MSGRSPEADTIHVVATTISGSLRDQRKVGRIGPELAARTWRPVRVHVAESHAQAEAAAREIVAGGGRLLVSAGGAGTMNAVLEGTLRDDGPPADLRLAFLRKGSADLIGKALGVPDDLSRACAAIAAGLDAERYVPADVLAIEAAEPDGTVRRRHAIGFSGLGVFGEVPRFTESRFVKWYKGLLSQAFGDLGPFLTGMTLAAGWWLLLRRAGRVPAIGLDADGVALEPERWAAVMVLNGDLGSDFPLGRGLPLGSGSFRVVALRYRGLRRARRQVKAGRDGTLLDDPPAHDAVVLDARRLIARPAVSMPYLVNVDGLRMEARGVVTWSVAGRVSLVSARG